MIFLLRFENKSFPPSTFLVNNAELFAGFVLPLSIAVCGILGPTFFFEWAVRHPYFQQHHITYKEGEKRYGKRDSKHLNTVGDHDKLAAVAVRRVAFIALLSATLLYCLKLSMFSAQALVSLPPTSTMVLQYVCYHYFSDLFAWICHFAVHKNDFLWRHVHGFHHQEQTPTALAASYSTLYDYFLFGGVPNIVSATVLQPHVLVFYAGLLTNMAGVAYLHSGIQHPVFDFFMSMGFLLPFHATSRLHDKHHRRAGRKAQDLGEHIWLWDYLARTLSPGPV